MAGTFKISETQSIILNFIRFLCSQGVLLGHLFNYFAFDHVFFKGLASYCVLIFFVLSGFLISLSLRNNVARDQNYGFKEYFRDRFFRIYPPLIGALVLVFAIDIIGFQFTGQLFSFKIYIGNFFINLLQLQEFPLATYLNEHYMIEFFRFHYFGTDLPLWTISIEWWLYMFYGVLVFYFFRKRKIDWRYLVPLLFLAITPIYYLLVSARMERGLTLFWFLGVVITLTARTRKSNISTFAFILNTLFILLGTYGFTLFGYNLSIFILFLSLTVLISLGQQEYFKFNKIFKKVSEKLAGYSYSLYLLHYSLLYFITTVFQFEHDVANFIIVFLVVNIVGFGFAQIFETNSKKLKQSYENYRSRNH